MRAPTCRWLIAAALIGALTPDAHAGQVFVDVGNPLNRFGPGAVLSQGDIVVWTWVSGPHTVTSGITGSGAGNGIFNSDPNGISTHSPPAVFAWKSDLPSSVPYYCRLHFAMNMKSTIQLVGGQATADLRITEVRYDGVDNFVEIGNLPGNLQAPGASANLSGFRLSINGGPAITLAPQTLLEGAFLKLTPAGLARQGSAALYAPYLAGSLPGTGALTEPDLMIDYVEWGTVGGQPLEATAEQTVSPKVWTAGNFAEQVADGHAIAFCGVRHQYGVAFWSAVVNPTPGLPNDCSNPVMPTTWGRLKMLYR